MLNVSLPVLNDHLAVVHVDNDHLAVVHVDNDHLAVVHVDNDHLAVVHVDNDHLAVVHVDNDHLAVVHVDNLPVALRLDSLNNMLLPLRDVAFLIISSRSLKRRSFTIVGLCFFWGGARIRFPHPMGPLDFYFRVVDMHLVFFRMSRTFACVVFQSSFGDS